MYESYKKDNKKIDKSKIIIKEKVIGIATSINIECSRCNLTEIVSPSGTKYTGKNIKGEDSYHSSCNWFQLNIQLAMGTLASGIGSTNMSQLLSFLDIQNTKSLSKRFMSNMEKSIGNDLRKVATDSMLEAIEEEVRLTLNDEDKFNEYKRNIKNNTQGIPVVSPYLLIWVGVSVPLGIVMIPYQDTF